MRELAYAGLTFNAPLSESRAAGLVAALPVAAGAYVADFGCGWGELLLRILAANPLATGTGVDIDATQLDRAIKAARERGLGHRVAFVAADAGATNLLGDVVLCIGAAHAFGDTDRALAELGRRVTAGGAVLFGDGFWEREASTEAIELFGPLKRWDELFAAAAIAGYMVVGAERSTQEEWDTFEDLWLAGPLGSADPDIRATAEERARQYREVYRGILGFAWLMLKPE